MPNATNMSGKSGFDKRQSVNQSDTVALRGSSAAAFGGGSSTASAEVVEAVVGAGAATAATGTRERIKRGSERAAAAWVGDASAKRRAAA